MTHAEIIYILPHRKWCSLHVAAVPSLCILEFSSTDARPTIAIIKKISQNRQEKFPHHTQSRQMHSVIPERTCDSFYSIGFVPCEEIHTNKLETATP